LIDCFVGARAATDSTEAGDCDSDIEETSGILDCF